VVVLLVLQLGLGYLQGALLHRQHAELQSMRTDIQDLVDALEQSQGTLGGAVGEEEGWSFTRTPPQVRRPAPRWAKTRFAVLGIEEEEKALKELQASRDSGKKAVQDSRKAQQQISITENAKKAEEKAKIESVQNDWQKWSLAGLGLVVLAFILRAWWRRRG
jgi:hypothetical protein